jgi:hypothetical protein
MAIMTRSQSAIMNAQANQEKKTMRSHMKSIRKQPPMNSVFRFRSAYILSMIGNIDKKSSDRIPIIFKIFDYFVDIREDLWEFGPTFLKSLVDKLNEFICLDVNDSSFSERMYDYKTMLLPYIRS